MVMFLMIVVIIIMIRIIMIIVHDHPCIIVIQCRMHDHHSSQVVAVEAMALPRRDDLG